MTSGRSHWLMARTTSIALAMVGLVGMLFTGAALYVHWSDRQAWLESDERLQIERRLEANLPAAADDRPDQHMIQSSPPATPIARGAPSVPARGSLAFPATSQPQQRVVSRSLDSGPPLTPTPKSAFPTLSNLEVLGTTLRLSEVPQPGAPAVLVISLRNHATDASGPISVGVSLDWFDNYSIIGAIPPVLDDAVRDDGFRYFVLAGAPPGADVTFELHVTTLGETARTPTLKLPMYRRLSLGDVRPTLEVGSFSLGQVQSLSVPRLGIRTGVVGTSWEPPSFVAGQISSSASFGEGNSVLIGHRGGRAGDVFLPLIGARLGDEVVGVSYGVEQRYVVSEIRTLPGSDTQPIRATETPRITLMTCAGAWNPLTGDYSHRLWVIAEPPGLARTTLAATVERATQAAASAVNQSNALKARTEAALARTAITIIDTRSARSR